jgi:hypothetical protein
MFIVQEYYTQHKGVYNEIERVTVVVNGATGSIGLLDACDLHRVVGNAPMVRLPDVELKPRVFEHTVFTVFRNKGAKYLSRKLISVADSKQRRYTRPKGTPLSSSSN